MENKIEEIASELKMIIHDMRTPLASIEFSQRAIKKILPKLIEGFELAIQNNLLIKTDETDKINTLKEALDSIDLPFNALEKNINKISLMHKTLNNYQPCTLKGKINE